MLLPSAPAVPWPTPARPPQRASSPDLPLTSSCTDTATFFFGAGRRSEFRGTSRPVHQVIASGRLGGGADDDLVDVDLGGLLDREGDGARDRRGGDRDRPVVDDPLLEGGVREGLPGPGLGPPGGDDGDAPPVAGFLAQAPRDPP